MKLSRQQTLLDYDGFVEKFQPKKTTDDCYTPPAVFDAIAQWVRENIPDIAAADPWLRPFYPGRDYLNEDYPQGCAVVDNPPFSILSQIVRNYQRAGVKFFLFAPHLTSFHYLGIPGVTVILTDAVITYDNGAKVNTSFVTNCWPTDAAVVISGDLRKTEADADKAARPEKKQKVIPWPDNVTSAALLGKIIVTDINIEIPRGEVTFVRKLDNGQQIFGGGALVSNRVAAELRAAELRTAELRAAELRAAELRAAELRAAELRAAELRAAAAVALSQRELNIIAQMDKTHGTT